MSLSSQSAYHDSCTFRHCAEGVVSLADNTTVVGKVASQIGDFASRWVQSRSTDFNVLAAMTFPAEWVREHWPVISTPDGEHVLYTRYQASHPNGQPVLCGSGCRVPLRAKPRKATVRIVCTGCKSRCSVNSCSPINIIIQGIAQCTFIKVHGEHFNYSC